MSRDVIQESKVLALQLASLLQIPESDGFNRDVMLLRIGATASMIRENAISDPGAVVGPRLFEQIEILQSMQNQVVKADQKSKLVQAANATVMHKNYDDESLLTLAEDLADRINAMDLPRDSGNFVTGEFTVVVTHCNGDIP